MYALPYKTKQFFFVFIKLSIVVGACYFIYEKLTNNDALSFSNFTQILIKNNVFSSKNIIFLLILSFFNWFLEIAKWKKLVSNVKKITLKGALEQSLGALTASLFTPNRIGEYGAKAVYYTTKFRKRIMLVNLISNVLQMSITTILGIIGFGIYVTKYNLEIDYFKIARFFVFVVIAIILLGFGITKSTFTIKGFSIDKLKTFIIKYPKGKLLAGFILSFFRYIIFSFQFYVLLYIFKINLGYLDAMVIITSMYLLASIVPSIFIFDVVIKGSIAVYLFSLAGVNELIILSIITIMWLLNVVIPSIFGSYYVLNFNFPKSDDDL
ncbi:lysylphosphatidylglycerol synthase domain-containing protein [uncultured Algibacter sp.]|uniref:lysylphosphatidylglycerol synthase domain-containing protein n=1 Tax=uncultured Algibacter sp. TaxID=298659 RepID=UPI0026342C3B|nr:lysylphosphatidylglycerol synthase domain-containing protein [uncultured Algibacter sp.]